MSFASARKRVGVSQADAAGIIGVDQSSVSMWENGKTRPRASLLPKIAELYRCTIDDLLSGEPGQGKEEEKS